MSARPTCTLCARKHLAQAMINMLEAEKGYPRHAWVAYGHLAEAEDELLDKHPDIANSIRVERIAYMESVLARVKHYSVPIFDFIETLCTFDVQAPPDPTWGLGVPFPLPHGGPPTS